MFFYTIKVIHRDIFYYLCPLIALGVDFRAGISLVEGQKAVKGGKKLKMEDAVFVTIPIGVMPTISFNVTNKIDINLGTGYMYGIQTESGKGSGCPVIRVGINFHKANYGTEGSYRREKRATRDNGFQLTYETDFTTNKYWPYWNAISIIPTYKFNPHFTAGSGIGFGGYVDSKTPEKAEKYDYSLDSPMGFRFFLRGTYRLTDKRLSPMASVDLGIQSNKLKRYDMEKHIDPEKRKNVAVYVTPAIGLSLRTSPNSYLNVLAGGHLSTAPKDLTMSGSNIALNFTHTLRLGNKKLNKIGENLIIKRK